eukprot:COSAG02_NODE_143_length_34133_cov_272.981282_30_plen_240_part_00
MTRGQTERVVRRACTKARLISPSVIDRAFQTSHDCPSINAPNIRTTTCATCARNSGGNQQLCELKNLSCIRAANHLSLRVGVVAQLVVVLLTEQVGDQVGEDEGQRPPQPREDRMHNEQPIQPLLSIIRGFTQDLARPVYNVHRYSAAATATEKARLVRAATSRDNADRQPCLSRVLVSSAQAPTRDTSNTAIPVARGVAKLKLDKPPVPTVVPSRHRPAQLACVIAHAWRPGEEGVHV